MALPMNSAQKYFSSNMKVGQHGSMNEVRAKIFRPKNEGWSKWLYKWSLRKNISAEKWRVVKMALWMKFAQMYSGSKMKGGQNGSPDEFCAKIFGPKYEGWTAWLYEWSVRKNIWAQIWRLDNMALRIKFAQKYFGTNKKVGQNGSTDEVCAKVFRPKYEGWSTWLYEWSLRKSISAEKWRLVKVALRMKFAQKYFGRKMKVGQNGSTNEVYAKIFRPKNEGWSKWLHEWSLRKNISA